MRTNIATWERVVRIVGGGIVAIAAAIIALRVATFGYRAFAVAVVVVGLDFVVTGALGFCPLYARFGRRTIAPPRHPRA